MVLNRGGTGWGLRQAQALLSMGHAAGTQVVDTTAHESLVLTLTHPEGPMERAVGANHGASWTARVHQRIVWSVGLVMDVPRAQLVLPGDTVMTTGFDGVFPADVPVGLVSDIVEGDEADEFQTVVIALGAQYLSARHVTWLQSARTARIDSLSNPSSPTAP